MGRLKVPETKLVCEYCKKKFTRKRYIHKTAGKVVNKHTFCSHKCDGLWKAERGILHGVKQKTFCIKGHNLSKTRMRTEKGQPYCGECARIRSRLWGNHLKARYNISIEQYNILLEVQNNRCAICGIPGSENYSKKLCVDHDHKTGKVRGLLCQRCNWLLGRSCDNINVFKSAIAYLKKNMGVADVKRI